MNNNKRVISFCYNPMLVSWVSDFITLGADHQVLNYLYNSVKLYFMTPLSAEHLNFANFFIPHLVNSLLSNLIGWN